MKFILNIKFLGEGKSYIKIKFLRATSRAVHFNLVSFKANVLFFVFVFFFRKVAQSGSQVF